MLSPNGAEYRCFEALVDGPSAARLSDSNDSRRDDFGFGLDHTVEERLIMSSATSLGHRCPNTAMTPRAALGAALLAALASICSHTAYAQMEQDRKSVV